MDSKVRLLIFFILAALVSCSNDKDDPTPAACSAAWSTELQNEINAISSAATAYANNPSAENCTSYKAAYQKYIDALAPYSKCSTLTGQNKTDFENALQQAKDSLTSLC